MLCFPRPSSKHVTNLGTLPQCRECRDVKKLYRNNGHIGILHGKHSHSLLFGLIRRGELETAPFGMKISGCQLTTHPKNFQGGAFAYIDYFRTIREEMYRALVTQTHYSCIHLWELGKEKTVLFTSLKVFVVFDSTKMFGKQQKRNKQSHSFILHQKSSKSIY